MKIIVAGHPLLLACAPTPATVTVGRHLYVTTGAGPWTITLNADDHGATSCVCRDATGRTPVGCSVAGDVLTMAGPGQCLVSP